MGRSPLPWLTCRSTIRAVTRRDDGAETEQAPIDLRPDRRLSFLGSISGTRAYGP